MSLISIWRWPASLVLMGGLLASNAVSATEWTVRVQTADGKPLPDAVVWLTPGPSGPAKGAAMDQIHKTFVPYILPVQTGTVVDFPNSDSINHHVYSFSPAKRFELKLTPGSRTPHTQLFDKPGVVTLGCNIHDWMLGYIVVVDSPWFGQTDKSGQIRLNVSTDAPREVHVWHPQIADDPEKLVQALPDGGKVSFMLAKPLKPDLRRKAQDY